MRDYLKHFRIRNESLAQPNLPKRLPTGDKGRTRSKYDVLKNGLEGSQSRRSMPACMNCIENDWPAGNLPKLQAWVQFCVSLVSIDIFFGFVLDTFKRSLSH